MSLWKGNWQSLDSYMSKLTDPSSSKFYNEWKGGTPTQSFNSLTKTSKIEVDEDPNNTTEKCFLASLLGDEEEKEILDNALATKSYDEAYRDLQDAKKILLDLQNKDKSTALSLSHVYSLLPSIKEVEKEGMNLERVKVGQYDNGKGIIGRLHFENPEESWNDKDVHFANKEGFTYKVAEIIGRLSSTTNSRGTSSFSIDELVSGIEDLNKPLNKNVLSSLCSIMANEYLKSGEDPDFSKLSRTKQISYMEDMYDGYTYNDLIKENPVGDNLKIVLIHGFNSSIYAEKRIEKNPEILLEWLNVENLKELDGGLIIWY